MTELTSPPVSVAPARLPHWGLAGATGGLVVLCGISLFVGVNELSPIDFLLGRASDLQWQNLAVSRIPRTLAAVLAGSAMAMAGLLMQTLVRNRFVEPGTVGTTESAATGLLVATLLWPGAPLWAKMAFAVVCALAGTWAFLRLIRALPPSSAIITVPLVGLMLAGIVSAGTTYLAYRFDLLQSLGSWLAGDFSGVLRGRYELLWLAGVVAVAVWWAADRFTVASLGEAHATSLGLDYRTAMRLGLTLVAITSAVSLVVVGGLPFLGLVVPNLATRIIGDNLRDSLGWVAVGGASFVLACDVASRTINHPYEVPVGTVVGVTGAAIFLVLLLRGERR